jgi:hypothetical protein
LLAPANFAGQARAWAGALEPAGLGQARNWAYVANPVFAYQADWAAPIGINAAPRQFFADLWRQVLAHFDGVILESGRPVFGRLFGWAPEREAQALLRQGKRVALAWHGSDIRLPSWHMATHANSPYALPALRRRAAELEATAARHRAALFPLGLPMLVSTPDLLEVVPDAIWCPSVVALPGPAELTPVLERPVPRVVHVPSSPLLKGTDLIAPALRDLAAQGVIEYTQAQGLTAAQVLDLYRQADVVLDQFRLGIYGVAACEAMAAGRLVVSDVDPSVRAAVHQRTGLDLPVVQATAGELPDLIRRLVQRRAEFQATAQAGREFVATVHTGRLSAQAVAQAMG